MKKLVITMAVALAAVVTNAAAVSWTTGGLAYGGTTLGSNTAKGYLWVVESTVYNTYSSYTDGEALSKAIYADYKGKFGEATASGVSGKKGALVLADGTDYNAGESVYAIVLYTTTQGDKDYIMGNAGYVTLESAQNAEVSNMATFIGGSKNSATSYATGWAAVPEPTSGLLMLLGMAGLALRRRRA